MDEYIEINLRRNNKPLRIRRRVPGGIEFEERDPIERSVYIGFDAADEITRYRLRRIRQIRDWRPGEFKLNRSVPDSLVSYRGDGRPSLQAVIAKPPTGVDSTYAEFDLDLANPLQDVAGFVIHMGELVDGKSTNHLDLRAQLAKGPAKPFLYYTIA